MLPELDEIDDVDVLIAACLQVNGRAGWGLIARALDIPERTVLRRGQKLLSSGVVRVSTSIDSTKVAHARPLLLRIRTDNGMVWPVARSLAGRADASSVSVLEGSNEIAAMFMLRNSSSIGRMLFEELPATEGIRTTSATTVLRFFRTGYDWWPPMLSDEQVAQLRPVTDSSTPGGDLGETEFTSDEEAMVTALSDDGRLSVKSIAERLDITPQTARKRIDSLLDRGLLHVRTEVLPRVFGYGLEVLVWLKAPTTQMNNIGSALAQESAVKFCAAATGQSTFWVNALFRDEDDYYQFITGSFFVEHPDVELLESLVVLTPVLRGSLLVDDGPWLED